MHMIFYIAIYLIIGFSIAKGTEFVHKGKMHIGVAIIWPFVFACMVLCLLFFPGRTITDVKNYYCSSKKEIKIVEEKISVLEITERVKSRFELMDL